MKWYLMVIKKYSTFTGRARRKEFWMFVLMNLIFGTVAKLLDEVLGLNLPGSGFMDGGIINLLYSLFVIVPTLALTVRRFHDIGKSGWVYFRFVLAAILVTIVWVAMILVKAIKSGMSLDPEDMDLATMGQFLVPTMIYGVVMLGIGVWSLVLMVRDSQPGENKYGPNPKEENNIADSIPNL